MRPVGLVLLMTQLLQHSVLQQPGVSEASEKLQSFLKFWAFYLPNTLGTEVVRADRSMVFWNLMGLCWSSRPTIDVEWAHEKISYFLSLVFFVC